MIIAFVLRIPVERWRPFQAGDAILGGVFCVALSLVWLAVAYVVRPRRRPFKVPDGFWLFLGAGVALLVLSAVIGFLDSHLESGLGPAMG